MAWRWQRWGPPASGGTDEQPAAKLARGEWALKLEDILRAEKRAADHPKGYASLNEREAEQIRWLRKLASELDDDA